jgi:hypothetical protein
MVQSWLRKTGRIFRGWDNFAPNFKQCCGLTTDLVVDFLTQLQQGEVPFWFGYDTLLSNEMSKYEHVQFYKVLSLPE